MGEAMKVTFLVNSYATPTNLFCLLGSLLQQTDPSWEAIVLLNHPEQAVRGAHNRVIDSIGDDRINSAVSYNSQYSWDCYWACDWAMDKGLAKGDWICCASDDGYYVPEFVEEMTKSDADMVHCDVLIKKHLVQRRCVLNTLPKLDHIDKTTFMVRREKWIGFPHKNVRVTGPSGADGMAVQHMAEMGYKIDKVHLPLVVHN